MNFPSLLDGIRARVLPDPLDVLREDLALPVTDALLQQAQLAWCARWKRDALDAFVVHDALHYLLDAAPTPMGEGVVIAFQTANMLYDRSVFGAAPILIAGRLLRRVGWVRKAAWRRWAGARKRLKMLSDDLTRARIQKVLTGERV